MKGSCLQELGNTPQPQVHQENSSPKDIEEHKEKFVSSRMRHRKAAFHRSPAYTPKNRRQSHFENKFSSGDEENTAGGDEEITAGGDEENTSGGDEENTAGGDEENTAGGDERVPRRPTRKKKICSAKRSAQKSTVSVNHKDYSSADDSQPEDFGMKTRSQTLRQDIDNNQISNDNNLQTSPKRKEDELSGSDPSREIGKYLRSASPSREGASDPEDADSSKCTSAGIGPETHRSRETSGEINGVLASRATRTSRSKQITDETRCASVSDRTTRSSRTPRTKKNSDVKEISLNTPTSKIARAPKSSRKGCDGATRSPRLRRSTVSTSLQTKETSDEDTDEELQKTRPSGVRRSFRIASTEVSTDDDYVLRGKKARKLKSTVTSSRRAKTPRIEENHATESVSDGLVEAAPETSETPRENVKTPKRKFLPKTPRNLMPAMPERRSIIPEASSLDLIRANLHVSAVPKSLPCREKEFDDIYNFVGGKISDSAGGCMYISGIPGTGKTATVHAVVRRLEQDVAEDNLPPFQYVEVNGLRLTEPRQVFVRILQQLTGEKCTPAHAQEILAKRFTSGKGFNKAILVLVDEVDTLRNRRQDVVYNLFDWPSKAHSKLVVLTIANTMDLPERLLMGRVTSRLGLTRLIFQPYNFKQLQQIVMERLQGSDHFNPEAVQLVARKVAAVTGDARRALDICRRATELLSGNHECVTMTVVKNALDQMMNSASIKTLKACSRMEQLFLQAVVAEIKRTGTEETNFISVYRQLKSICDFHGIKVLNVSESLGIVNRLGSSHILVTQHGKADIMQTIYLNVSSDDIHYAMTKPVAE